MDIMNSFNNMSVSKNIDFSMDSEKDSTDVWIDQDSFDKIVFNIISNAFKYTPEGGSIKIDVSGPKRNTGRLAEKIAGYVDITVTNTGNHIEDKDIDKIFERYYQSNVYDPKAGSGIGLNLARTLVEMHHGVISAANTPDGAAFTISLPAGSEHLSKEELEASVQSADIYSKDIVTAVDAGDSEIKENDAKVLKSKRNVVFVDDNVEMLNYLKMELNDIFNIEIFDNVKDAWASITANLPDAVITDLIMSTETEGAEFCEKIKHNPGTNHIPVLILTSKIDEESVQKCTECGADRYLTKPISTKLLKSTIVQTITARDIIRNKYTKEVGYDFEEVKMSSSDDKLLSRVIESIKANIDNPDYGVEDLSRDVGMSRVHMNRKLKECINLSPSNLIKSIRLKQAAYLLANNKVNISEVAYRLGFSTHSYFSSSFHDYFGLTPKEFAARYSDSKDKESLKKLLEL